MLAPTVHIAHIEQAHFNGIPPQQLEGIMSKIAELITINAATAASLAATNERLLKITQEQASLLDAIAQKDDRIAELEALVSAGEQVPEALLTDARATQAKAENVGRLVEVMDQLVPDAPVAP